MISVIVPVYNAEKYIKDCVDSILAQTYPDFELILVDDGSPDRSGELCNAYARRDHRIRVIHKENEGVSSARNTGLDAAAGKYIGFVDADDLVEPTYLEGLLRGMTEGGFSVAGVVRDMAPGIEGDIVKRLTRTEAELAVLRAGGIHGWSVARLFDGEILRENQVYFDPEISQCEDELFCIKYLSCVKEHTAVSSEAKYHYRSNPNGALRSRYCRKTPDRRDFSEILAVERMEPLIEHDGEVYQAWKQRRTKAAAASLRTMISCRYADKDEMSRLRALIRHGCVKYLLGDTGAVSSRFSVLLSAISPELEWRVFQWRSL